MQVMARKLRSINRRLSCINHAINRLSAIVAIFHTLPSYKILQIINRTSIGDSSSLRKCPAKSMAGIWNFPTPTTIAKILSTNLQLPSPTTHSLTIGLISFSIQYFFLVFVLLAYIAFAVGKILIQETFWRCKLFKNANATLLVVIVLKIVECESHAAAREAKCLLDRM